MTANDHPAVGLIYKRTTVRATINAYPEYVALLRPLWKLSGPKKWDFSMLSSFAGKRVDNGVLNGLRFNPRER